jgi:hypothetical protein
MFHIWLPSLRRFAAISNAQTAFYKCVSSEQVQSSASLLLPQVFMLSGRRLTGRRLYICVSAQV